MSTELNSVPNSTPSGYISRIPAERLPQTRLVALDLDGTLFTDDGRITPASIEAINRLIYKGIHVVISTGRPLSGVPFAQLKDTKIDYAITTNGSSVYRIHDRKCIFDAPLPDETSKELIRYFLTKDVHIAAFIEGDGITPEVCQAMVPRLIVTESIKDTYRKTRIHVPDLIGEIEAHNYHVDKITLNFQECEDGSLLNRQEVYDHLMAMPELEVVSGGYLNLEMTRKGIDKGVGLTKLAEYLGVPVEYTMAVGDTENDIPCLRDAGIAVAMGNAIPEMLEMADIITLSNNEDGVAYVLNQILN